MASIPTEKRPGYVAERDTVPILGPLPMELPEGGGLHVGQQCQSCTTIDAAHAAGDFVVLFLARALNPVLRGLGFYVPLEPNQARSIAAALIQAADNLDGGKGKQ